MLKAIDMHTHIHTGDRARQRTSDPMKAGRKEKGGGDEMAEMYQRLEMMAVIFDVDQETRTGLKISNEEIAGWVKKYPKTFIGYGSVDPWKGNRAAQEVQRCADMGLRGMKFQQAVQGFAPNNPRFFPIYEACVRLSLPVIFHGGTTAIHAGTPGGGGLLLEYCRPIPYIDEIAARYPDMRIILAHPAWPWHDEQLAVMRHKANVYMDLSGWAPKYFPPSIIQNANTLLQDKVFFGSDFPVLTPERWLSEFAALAIKDAVRPKILLHNAAKFLDIELSSGLKGA